MRVRIIDDDSFLMMSVQQSRSHFLVDGPHDAVDAFSKGTEQATAASTTTRKIRLGLSRLLQADNATTRFVEELVSRFVMSHHHPFFENIADVWRVPGRLV